MNFAPTEPSTANVSGSAPLIGASPRVTSRTGITFCAMVTSRRQPSFALTFCTFSPSNAGGHLCPLSILFILYLRTSIPCRFLLRSSAMSFSQVPITEPPLPNTTALFPAANVLASHISVLSLDAPSVNAIGHPSLSESPFCL